MTVDSYTAALEFDHAGKGVKTIIKSKDDVRLTGIMLAKVNSCLDWMNVASYIFVKMGSSFVITYQHRFGQRFQSKSKLALLLPFGV
jgi:hypothetical protein